MLFGSVSKDPPPMITINNSPAVQSFKSLGVLLTSTLSWSEHITAVCTEASQWLYLLKLLKCSGMMSDDLLCYYNIIIRTVTGRCMCCLVFKYHSRRARPIGGNTAVSSSNHFCQQTGLLDSCHHTWYSTACRQTRQTNETVVYWRAWSITLFAQTVTRELCRVSHSHIMQPQELLSPNHTHTSILPPSGLYWSKRQWTAVASAGPYTNLHLDPDR